MCNKCFNKKNLSFFEKYKKKLRESSTLKYKKNYFFFNSNEIFKTYFEQSYIGLAILTPDKKWGKVNNYLANMLGYSPKEFENLKWTDTIYPDDLNIDSKKYQKLLNGEINGYFLDKRLIKKNNELIYTRMSLTCLRTKDNSIKYLIASFQDITKIKEYQENLKENKELFTLFMDNLPAGVFIKDPDLYVQYINKYLKDNFDAIDWIGRNNYENINDKELAEKINRDDNFALNNGLLLTDQKFTLKSGIVKYFHTVKFPIIRKNGVKLLGEISLDITERKEIEELLDSERERLIITLKSIGDGFISIDDKGKIINANDVAANFFGRKINEMLFDDFNDYFKIFNSFDKEINLLEIINKKKSKIEFKNIMIKLNNNLQKNIYISASPIIKNKKFFIGSVIVFKDITDQLIKEKEIEKNKKLESIGLLAGGIAHDFNNLLTVILGNIQILKFNIDKNNENFEIIQDAENAVSRAKHLANQLLTFAKGGAPIRKYASIKEIIIDSSSFVLRGNNVSGKYIISDDLFDAFIDEGQISQVIQNIVLNSSQAMPEGGEIIIKVNNYFNKDHYTELEPGNYIKISIKDNGLGIPENIINKIFDPYFTTKDKGSGLGLSIVYSIVKKHNGVISVNSVVNMGTEFTILLPAKKMDKLIQVKKNNLINYGKGKILIIDDDINILKVSKKIITKLGYYVETVDDCIRGLSLYEESMKRNNNFDVIILDLTLPGDIGGEKAIVKFIELDPGVNAIVSSGYSNNKIFQNYNYYGFKACIKKPYNVYELSNILSNITK